MATQLVTPAPTAPKTITVSKWVFDLDSLTKVKKEVNVELPAPLTVDNIGQLTDEQIVSYANRCIAKDAVKAAKANIEGASPAVVNMFLRTFRMLPMNWVDANGQKVKDESLVDRKAQTAKIFAFIRTQPEMLEDLKTLAKSGQVEESEEEEDGDEVDE